MVLEQKIHECILLFTVTASHVLVMRAQLPDPDGHQNRKCRAANSDQAVCKHGHITDIAGPEIAHL